MYKQLILPVSSWAYWAGLLSNATEIHVNGPPHHSNMGGDFPNYIYHNEKARKFFGRWDNNTKDIEYAMDNPIVKEPAPVAAPTSSPLVAITSVNATSGTAVVQNSTTAAVPAGKL